MSQPSSAELAEIVALVAKYEALEAAHEAAPSVDTEQAIDDFLRLHPVVYDYDARGNYIGTVRNENGWTP